jgi:UDP-N-acetylglucosamine--N-acetylmuramyl-(pentapeptide) pyrophosphoryl-undecaprenol N-acetylglucosamine transferase
MYKPIIYLFFLCIALFLIVRYRPANENAICIVAGRSGGHILPGLTLANRYACTVKNPRILFFTTDNPLDKSLIGAADKNTSSVFLKLINFPGKAYWQYPLFTVQLLYALLKSFFYLASTKPAKIISTGGYISLPVCCNAWLLNIPIEVYELNVVPGKATLWLASLASKIYICFPQAARYFKGVCEVVDYPLRFTQADRISRDQACQKLGLDSRRKVLFVLGGSQGSRFINTLITSFIASSPELVSKVAIIHQTGPQDVNVMKMFYSDNHVQAIVFDYKQELNLCYSAADYSIARAGAGTLFELLFFKKPALLIPLQTNTTAHQKDNAYAAQQLNPSLFTVLEQASIEADNSIFFGALKALL